MTLAHKGMIGLGAGALLSILAYLAFGPDPSPDGPVRRVEIASHQELEALFEDLGYTREAWLRGERRVPRLRGERIPPRWRDQVVKEISVPTKKRIFFRVLAPMVLRANEKVLADRQRLLQLAESGPASEADRQWLAELARRYRVAGVEAGTPTAEQVDALLMRVDIVPLSLALAQAAEESGWGTSRFAAEGQALFGQWSWGDGMVPREQRDGMGDYRVKAFAEPQHSIDAYVHNLNTHRSYAAFREARAKARHAGREPRGLELVGTLTKYAERGPAYVKTLTAIIRSNGLADADHAYLDDGPTYLLVPVGPGSS